MPAVGRSDRPVSEILKIAFDALKQHEKRLDKALAKLEQDKDELTINNATLGANLNEILEKLSALEQDIKKLSENLPA